MTATSGERTNPAGSPSRSVPEGGLWVWVAAVGPIGAWAVHEVTLGSLSRLSCNSHAFTWLQHATTVAMAGFVLGCIFVSARLIRAGGSDSEESGSPGGRIKFIGMFGVLVGVANLALILLEGSYVVFIHPCLKA
jgi:hypothetical protein